MTTVSVTSNDPLIPLATAAGAGKGGAGRSAQGGAQRAGSAGRGETAPQTLDPQVRQAPEGKGRGKAPKGAVGKRAGGSGEVGAEQTAAALQQIDVQTPFAKMMRELGGEQGAATVDGTALTGIAAPQAGAMGPKAIVTGVEAGGVSAKVGPAKSSVTEANKSISAANTTVGGAQKPVSSPSGQIAGEQTEAVVAGKAGEAKSSAATTVTEQMPAAGTAQQPQHHTAAAASTTGGTIPAEQSAGAASRPSDATARPNDSATTQDPSGGQAGAQAPVQESVRASGGQSVRASAPAAAGASAPVQSTQARKPAAGRGESPSATGRSRGHTDVSARPTAMSDESAKGTVEIAGGEMASDRSQAAGTVAAAEPAGVTHVEPVSQAHGMAPTVALASPGRPGVADQIAEQVRQGAPQIGQRVVVRLDPPELGRVRLTLRGGRGGVRGVIEVDSARTLTAIQNATPPMLERLAEAGVPLRRLEVVLTGGGEAGSGDGADSSLRDSAFGQQHDGAGEQGPAGGRGRWSGPGGADEAAPSPRGPSPTHVSDDSINVWI